MAKTWKQLETEFVAACTRLGLPVEVNYVGKQSNVPGVIFWGGSPDKLTIHETANTHAGADARMHRNFVANGGGVDRASFTAAVDDKRVVLILRLDWGNYHAGTQTGNFDSLSIETCINSDAVWAETKRNLAKVAAAMLHVWGMPIGTVVQHNVWWGKNCPATIRREGTWGAILQAISANLSALQENAPEPTSDQKMEDYARRQGAARNAGVLIKPTHKRVLEDGSEWDVRVYERWIIHTKPGLPVFEARDGWMYLKAKGEI
jgi:N-acetylmuramoyl-L-alanine amidase CwlA